MAAALILAARGGRLAGGECLGRLTVDSLKLKEGVGKEGVAMADHFGKRRTCLDGERCEWARRCPHPLFFVSVAAKGLRNCVSLLFATLRGGCVSVAAKGVTLRGSG